MYKILAALYERFFGFSKNLSPVLSVERTTEIQCVPTFWRFIDDKNQLLNWGMSETIQLVDNEKIRKLVFEHLSVEYPSENKSQIIRHIYVNHFDEVKQEQPKNIVTAVVDYNATVTGIKNILTGEGGAYSTPRYLVQGNELIQPIRPIDWDIIDKIMNNEKGAS